ncbi:hypothetical protein QBC40DRAFT_300218 [Triangularia verruculosa]|uniref:Uncharacterized protein n=1 Tax=Triangularia verruculosa TaxID=2587418 RepID=A0AAN7ARC1_9PEZI|nr:hypothetical protein QBC40DRAFT_300218 [Triangularia verruculosa]
MGSTSSHTLPNDAECELPYSRAMDNSTAPPPPYNKLKDTTTTTTETPKPAPCKRCHRMFVPGVVKIAVTPDCGWYHPGQLKSVKDILEEYGDEVTKSRWSSLASHDEVWDCCLRRKSKWDAPFSDIFTQVSRGADHGKLGCVEFKGPHTDPEQQPPAYSATNPNPISTCTRCHRLFTPSGGKASKYCEYYHPGELRPLRDLLEERGDGATVDLSRYGSHELEKRVWSCCLNDKSSLEGPFVSVETQWVFRSDDGRLGCELTSKRHTAV